MRRTSGMGGTRRWIVLGIVSAGALMGERRAAGQSLQMKGSDPLENVVKDAIAGASLQGVIVFVGGGSGGAQAAMTSMPPTQQIAPMTRQLNGMGCATAAPASQELIGLEAVTVIGANQTGGDSNGQTAATDDDCNDN